MKEDNTEEKEKEGKKTREEERRRRRRRRGWEAQKFSFIYPTCVPCLQVGGPDSRDE